MKPELMIAFEKLTMSTYVELSILARIICEIRVEVDLASLEKDHINNFTLTRYIRILVLS